MPLFYLLITLGLWVQDSGRIVSKSGSVHFRSDAPLELIEAESHALRGIVDKDARSFAFTVPVETFDGFNSRLQREHFMENYMETEKFPRATYEGKIIDPVDFAKAGEYVVRTKGSFSVHGISRERIIEATVTVEKGGFKVRSEFLVSLEDHNIIIPKIVNQKIAREIQVTVEAEF